MAIPAKGVLFAVDFTGGTYVTISERTSISGPSWEVRTTEVTHLDSSAAQYLATIPDGGEVSCEFFYDPDNSSHSALTDLMATPAVVSIRITFTDPSPTTYTMDAILTGFEPDVGSVDDAVIASASFKVTGLITVA